MASSKEYLAFILDQLSDLDGISYRQMMREYILYYHGKIVGGIYDDRLLLKRTESAKFFLKNAPLAAPYAGTKEMLLIENVDSREFLVQLFNAVFNELPPGRKTENREDS